MADRIVRFLHDQVFTVVRPSQRLHSNQGGNFESHILTDLCKAFNITTSHTIPSHPMGDSLVEQVNWSLLILLWTFVEKQEDWEQNLQFLLYIYHTTKHSSTDLSPFEVSFGWNPQSLHIHDFHFRPRWIYTTSIEQPKHWKTWPNNKKITQHSRLRKEFKSNNYVHVNQVHPLLERYKEQDSWEYQVECYATPMMRILYLLRFLLCLAASLEPYHQASKLLCMVIDKCTHLATHPPLLYT